MPINEWNIYGTFMRTSKDGGNANKCMEHLWPDTNTKTIPSMGFGISVPDTNTKTIPSMGFGISVPDTKKPELIRAYEYLKPA